jgi:hypothetical protein
VALGKVVPGLDNILFLKGSEFELAHPKLWVVAQILAVIRMKGKQLPPVTVFMIAHPHKKSNNTQRTGHLSSQRQKYSFSKLKRSNSKATPHFLSRTWHIVLQQSRKFLQVSR